MELKLYLAILWQRRLLIIASAGLGLVLGVLGALLLPLRYQAQTIMRVPTPLVGSRESTYYDLDYASRLMNTYAQEATGPGMATLLAEQFGRAPKISAGIIGNSELMEIVAEGPDPQVVALAANYVADYFVQQRAADLPRPLAALQRATANTIVSPAAVPTMPISPRLIPSLVLGLLGGLIVGVGLAFLRENLDRRLYTSAQIVEATGLATLAQIPVARAIKPNRYLNGMTPEGEAFRQLRTNLLSYSQQQTLRSLLVTSAQDGQGNTTTVASLAVALAQAGRTVVAVDCDLRKPSLHKALGVSNGYGLSEVLDGRTTLEIALQNHATIDGLAVLPGGSASEHPAELIGSNRMQELLCQLTTQFNFVLIDAPALTVTDASILAANVDGVILVVGRGLARKNAVAFACEQLATVKAQPLGVVIN